MLDRGFLYGDSIYEVTMTVKGKPLLLEEHFDRLDFSASQIGLDIRLTREELRSEIDKTLKAHGGQRNYVRLIVTRGEGEITLDPNAATENNIVIIVKTLPEYPREWYTKGVHMIVAGVIRNPKTATDPNVKSGNYLNNVLAMREAKQRGAFDAIMLNEKGFVTEATTSNLWMVKDNTFYTPPLASGLLGGITRATLLDICQKSGLKALEKDFTADEMKTADECFLTSTSKELVPIVKIDDSQIGPGSPGNLTKKLHSLYLDHVMK